MTGRKSLSSLIILTLTSAIVIVGPTAVAATIAPVTPDPGGATTLASAMVAQSSTLVGATFDAHPPAGTPNGTSDQLSFFPTNGSNFGIMTSGDVNLADDPNDSASSGANDGGGNVRGDSDLDVSILRLQLNAPAGTNCLRLDFAFYSEEFPEFVGSNFNDAFIAELDQSTWTTQGSQIMAPDNFAFDPNGDPISINSTGATSMNEANAQGTTYDGATQLLQASVEVSPGAHDLFLSIFDQGDEDYDSAVFADNIRFLSLPNPQAECQPGAEPPTPSSKADLSLAKSDSPDPVTEDQPLTYTLSVHNGGPDGATGVVVEDQLPPTVTFVSASPSQGSCSRNGQTVTCNLGNIGNGAGATVTIEVTPNEPGTITNEASVKSDNDPDTGNNSASESTTVEPANREPNCSGVTADPSELWPPNHKFRTVSLSGATDPDGDATTISVAGVTQDEPVDGQGDGDTSPDAQRTSSDHSVLLRAERSGTGDGRVYRITFVVEDSKGATCSGATTVTVPHDQSGEPAKDSGQHYGSFG